MSKKNKHKQKGWQMQGQPQQKQKPQQPKPQQAPPPPKKEEPQQQAEAPEKEPRKPITLPVRGIWTWFKRLLMLGMIYAMYWLLSSAAGKGWTP